MYIIVTRSFPPDSGGMQSLMWGLTNTISKNYMVKVFADESDKNKDIDKSVSFSIERIGGPKIISCLLYTSPSPRDGLLSRMPSSA